jgi:hypothetical protein
MIRFDPYHQQPDVRNLSLEDILSVRDIVKEALEKNFVTHILHNVIVSLNDQARLLEDFQ